MVSWLSKKLSLIVFFVAVSTCTHLTYSQYIDIDSLETLLSQNPPETIRVKLLIELSRELLNVDSKRSLNLAEEGLGIAIKLNSKIDEAATYRILSGFYASQNLYSLSTELVLKAQRIFEAEGDSVGIADCNINFGKIYRIQNLHKKSAEHHKLAYDFFKDQGNSERLAIASLNYGEALYYTGELQEAKKLQHQALSLSHKNNNQLAKTFSLRALGLIYTKEEKYDSAEYYFKAVIKLSNLIGENSHKVSTLESMVELANLYKKFSKNEDYRKKLETAENYALKNQQSYELVDIYFQLAIYHVENRNINMTKAYLNNYERLKDSLSTAIMEDKENLLNTVYNSMKVGVENQVLEEQQEFSESLIQKQQTYLVIVAVLAAVTFFALLYALLSGRKLQRSVKLLNQQKEQIRHKSEELEELIRTKDKMFSIISHDLRSPLQSIIGFSELVRRHMDSLSQEEITEMMQQLNENVRATLKMTDNLIQWGMLQMDQSSIIPVEFNMAEIITTLKDVYQPVAEQKNITLSVDPAESCTVYADPNHTELIVRNLVNNAIKFTESKGEIKIICMADKDYTSIAVEDTGRGIPESIINNLFSLKITSMRGTAGEKGTGLGLMLCQEYALQNKGKIEVESKEGEGSVFKLYLPNKPLE
ncbi:tetratricopeptide repeat-containing sensor histidine kinase [Fulvivirga lutimaris]|uniref:tetratricopeptide repeat-containing sensor histidine kinase n=1 Tax=Fulvivirga lutimaris TaxID=1819566 RepID=UPI0012BD3B2C|nr:tetratricopeptide repeat-containing sensor histidine kinase [Fulvivirga lutimaris]MTI40216.1 sensor histidine kinase [Fulvivirga lutimaris]